MACDLLDYVNFDAAIKTGDIGTLQDCLPCLLFWFIGGKNKNYTIEILKLLQGLHREWPPDLKWAHFSHSDHLTAWLGMCSHRNYIIKYCWLESTAGSPDGFLPINLLQEHNVLNIKVSSGSYVIADVYVCVVHFCWERSLCWLELHWWNLCFNPMSVKNQGSCWEWSQSLPPWKVTFIPQKGRKYNSLMHVVLSLKDSQQLDLSWRTRCWIWCLLVQRAENCQKQWTNGHWIECQSGWVKRIGNTIKTCISYNTNTFSIHCMDDMEQKRDLEENILVSDLLLHAA